MPCCVVLRRVPCYGCAWTNWNIEINVTFYSVTLARTIWLPDDGPRIETCRNVFNVLTCKCYEFYICVVVGVIIEWIPCFLLLFWSILWYYLKLHLDPPQICTRIEIQKKCSVQTFVPVITSNRINWILSMYDPTAIEDLPSGHAITVTWYFPNTACLHSSLLSGELPARSLLR